MFLRQVVVQIKAAKTHEKHLAPGAQPAARLDGAGDHLQLIRERIGDRLALGVERTKARRKRCAERLTQQLLGIDRSGNHPGVFLLEQVRAAVAGDQRLERRRRRRRVVELGIERIRSGNVVDGHRAAGADLILHGRTTGQKDRIAGHTHAGEGRPAIARGDQVGHLASPTDGAAFRSRRLPKRGLVVVRKELGGQRHRFGAVLRLGRRAHQRADVEQYPELSAIEQIGKRGVDQRGGRG